MSGVSIPRCSIGLNWSVSGKGSLTAGVKDDVRCWFAFKRPSPELTEDEAAEEEVDPSHDDGLRHHHDHALLHLIHHAVHSPWICERALWLVPLASDRLREVLSCTERIDQVGSPGEEGGGWNVEVIDLQHL